MGAAASGSSTTTVVPGPSGSSAPRGPCAPRRHGRARWPRRSRGRAHSPRSGCCTKGQRGRSARRRAALFGRSRGRGRPRQAGRLADHLQPHLDRRALRRVPRGVVEEVRDHLMQLVGVAEHDHRLQTSGHDSIRLRDAEIGHRIGRDAVQHHDLARTRLGVVETRQCGDVGDEAAQADRLGFGSRHRRVEVASVADRTGAVELGVPRIVVTGVRSSCDASARNWRSRSSDAARSARPARCAGAWCSAHRRDRQPPCPSAPDRCASKVTSRDRLRRRCHSLNRPNAESEHPPRDEPERDEGDEAGDDQHGHQSSDRGVDVDELEAEEDELAVRGHPGSHPVSH